MKQQKRKKESGKGRADSVHANVLREMNNTRKHQKRDIKELSHFETIELKLNILLIICAAIFVAIVLFMSIYALGGENIHKWIITIVSSIVIITITLISIALLLSDREEEREKCWYVELWNVNENYGIHFVFPKSMVIGRYTLLKNTRCDVPVKEDTTISRNHILLYEQSSLLWMRNMSKVNMAVLDDHELVQPQQLRVGSRLKMGDSAFLVIRVEKE